MASWGRLYSSPRRSNHDKARDRSALGQFSVKRSMLRKQVLIESALWIDRQ